MSCGICTASNWISVAQWKASEKAWSTSVAGVVCLEVPITELARIEDRKYPNREDEITLVDSYGEPLADFIEKYAIVGKYMMGENRIIEDVVGYFWVDLHTGAHDYFENKNEYLDSLRRLGINQIPALISASSICETRTCQPCVTPSP
jgi:hypothetical protein